MSLSFGGGGYPARHDISHHFNTCLKATHGLYVGCGYNDPYFPRFTRLPNNWRGKLLREGADNAEWRGRSLFRDTMASRRCESPVPCRSTGDGDQGFDLTRGMWCCSLPQSPSLLRSRSSPHFPAHHDEVD
ncbi:hypothetical protein FOZ60_010534 [Perkinsus olseni]|uniref:Uncharacterized protein n=1 Tax=Perkinsus olseni TaxID=32597 RepID=A0A7J6S1D5_PEROL|nr:hypothetical protein FOZ60_010534 [Perkinsus olseni]KAF4726553.1 hypothetical protein FOZ62_001836 [Perkinsus olseni]